MSDLMKEVRLADAANATHRHVKTGRFCSVLEYEATLEATGQEVVVYRDVETGRVWVRPADEIADNARFQTVRAILRGEPIHDPATAP